MNLDSKSDSIKHTSTQSAKMPLESINESNSNSPNWDSPKHSEGKAIELFIFMFKKLNTLKIFVHESETNHVRFLI